MCMCGRVLQATRTPLSYNKRGGDCPRAQISGGYVCVTLYLQYCKRVLNWSKVRKVDGVCVRARILFVLVYF